MPNIQKPDTYVSSPSAIAFTAHFGENDVGAGLAREVLQILGSRKTSYELNSNKDHSSLWLLQKKQTHGYKNPWKMSRQYNLDIGINPGTGGTKWC